MKLKAIAVLNWLARTRSHLAFTIAFLVVGRASMRDRRT
jgi:hypothetical protein